MASQAEYMRGYRRTHPEKIQAIEERRNGTPKRKKWREEYTQHYTRNPNVKIRVNKAVKNLYRKRKLELTLFMGGKCLMCGLKPEDVDGCLSVFVVDEISPLGIGRKKFTTLSQKRLDQAKQLFSEHKLQLLCQNCSAIKTWKNNDCSNKKQNEG